MQLVDKKFNNPFVAATYASRNHLKNWEVVMVSEDPKEFIIQSKEILSNEILRSVTTNS